MADFLETISETEFVLCPEPELATYPNEYCDTFEEIWPPTTVETAVTRGKKLRECKPPVQLHHEYRVGIDYVTPCPEKKRSHRKCYQRPCYDIYNSPCISMHSPPSGCCPNTSSVRCKTYKKSQTSLPHHKQCPLRIMELAAPTKRHCLDTWRSKSHILPDHMLDRIRQHVMDEIPVAQIPDALNCFKKRVSNRSSRNCKSKVSDACMSDMRKYSAIFAYCVSRKLDKPLNITLNPELEKISRIVSYEISRVSSKDRRGGFKNSKKNKFEKQIQDEMSKKVTAWIDNVLEDTSEKLLQDDLRDLEEEEGPVLDIIDDLIDNVVTSHEPEEEDTKYGTAGDITEDDTAPDQTSEDIDVEGEEKGNDLSIEGYHTRQLHKETDDEISKGEDNLTTDVLNYNIGQVKDNITGAITDEIDTGPENTNDVTMPHISDENLIDNVGEVIDNITDTVADDIYPGHENINQNPPSNKASEYVFEHVADEQLENQPEKVDENVEESDDSKESNSGNDNTGETTNVSALYMKSEELVDDMNKTVKISKVDDDLGIIGDLVLENQKAIPQQIKNENSPIQAIKNEEKEIPPQKIKNEENNRHKTFGHENITFASPNASLLSIVDESWPSDISIDGPKLNSIVSKSVMSLGFIDENVYEAIDDISVGVTAPYGNKPGDDIVINNTVAGLQNKGNYIQGKPFNQGKDKNIHDLESPKFTEEMKHSKNEIIQSVHTFDNMSDKEKDKNSSKHESPSLMAEEIKHLRKETEKSMQTFDYKSVKEKDKNENGLLSPALFTEEITYLKNKQLNKEKLQSLQTSDDISDNLALPNKKVNYKVDTTTAPSWIVSGLCDKGRGEPEDSFSKHKHKSKCEINEGDVRIMAKNLEIISANLLIWSDWIDTTCRNVIRIKRKAERNTRKSCYWIKFEKYISIDAHFWLKFKHSAKNKLKTYRYIYRPKKYEYDAPVHAIKCNCNCNCVD